MIAEKSVLDHIESSIHQALKPICNLCNITIDYTQNAVADHKNSEKQLAELYTHYHLQLNSDDITNVRFKCNVCNTYIDVSQSKSHVESASHHTKLYSMLSSNNIEEEDDKYVCNGHNRLASYCVLCNKNIVTKNGHITSDAHVNILKKAIADGAKTKKNNNPANSIANTKKSNKRQTYCNPCNRYIDSHNFEAHTKGAIHKNNAKAVNASKSNTGQEGTEGAIENLPNKTYCAPCNIHIETKNFSSHLNGQRHQSNIDITPNENPWNTTKYCETCKVHVKTKDFLTHENSMIHMQRVFDPSALAHMDNTPGHLFFCRICCVKITKSPKTLNEHVIGANHVGGYESILNSNKIIKYNKHFYNCNVCKTMIAEKSVLDHIESSIHQALKPRRICNLCNITIDYTQNAVTDHKNSDTHRKQLAELYTHYHLQLNSDDITNVRFKCNVCNTYVDVSQSKSHVESASHHTKLYSMLSSNNIEEEDDKYVCNVCSVIIENKKELKHVTTQFHIKQLSAVYYCPICDVRVPNNEKNIKSHEQGYNHQMNLADSDDD
ncbi:unnamed protein product [Diatraea saccharalis]|uniref:Matrin-type domain-containing protein n=1 Tax=Diatraea saccharalis TaxID=40085 RepID=A0A9N9R671_9NEOP|nr:unnamed protein product [Diatraea saccharalis]